MTIAPLSGDCLRMYLMFLFQAVGVLVQMGILHLTKLPHSTLVQTNFLIHMSRIDLHIDAQSTLAIFQWPGILHRF